jgi:hypothetical protein
MLIYIILITYIFAITMLLNQISSNETQKKKLILFFGLLGIFAVLALKKDTVGIDISGYKAQYDIIKNVKWFDYDYVYFEKGYMLLTQIFSKLGVSFQLFTAVFYGFLCYTLFKYLKNRSANPTFSLIMFICYQFFVFSISGIRQTIALSILIWAIYVIESKSDKRYSKFILSILLVLLAFTFHKSAIIGILIPFVSIFSNKRIHLSYYIITGFLVVLFRNLFLENIILYFFERDFTGTSITLGGNFMFLFFIGIVLFYIYQKFSNVILNKSIFLYTRISLITIILYLLLSGSTLLRGLMFFQFFMLVSIPFALTFIKKREKSLVLFILYIFFILLFYFETLIINQFELLPYLFFWE